MSDPYYADEFVTLYHGDCLDVLPSLSDVGLVLTSPPYNLGGAAAAGTYFSTLRDGYDDEHDVLIDDGWVKVDGKAGGGAGYSTRSDNGRRERLWLSPACIQPESTLFDLMGDAS